MKPRWTLPIAMVVLIGACADGEALTVDAAASAENQSLPPSLEAPTAPGPTATAASSSPLPPPPEPVFAAEIHPVTAEELGSSWRSECPVAVADLRRLDLSHWDYDGKVADGALVVHAAHADDVVAVFRQLFDERFPIESLRPITDFDASDDASMAANNSSAFNCRRIAGQPGVWSQHSFGAAIDLNPLVNPWVRGTRVDPPGGDAYVDRDPAVPGLIVAGDVVTLAFAEIGWHWGGEWTTTVDYQHFSQNGN